MDWQGWLRGWMQEWEQYKAAIDMFVPVFALLISFASILLTFLSIWAQGRQSRMSIMPMPYFRLSNYLNLVAVELVNGGLGTFVIESIVVTPDSDRARDLARKFLFPLQRSAQVDEARLRTLIRGRLRSGEFGSLIDCVEQCEVNTWDEFLAMAERRPVSPSEPVPLLMLSGKHEDADFQRQRDSVRFALAPMHAIVTGHDIHGNRFAATRSLQWFGETPRALSSRGPKGM